MKRLIAVWAGLALTVLIIFQPIFISVANAQVATTPINIAANVSEAQQAVHTETPATSVNDIFTDWTTLGWVTDLTSTQGTTSGVLDLSPQDESMIQICQNSAKSSDCKIDVRVTNYLTNLVAPIDQGGEGLSYVKANILKGYTTTGIGRYDKETLAQSDGDNLVSSHNTGKAVDISAVGQLTCKLVEKKHGLFGIGGGDTTVWQKPTPVKVAWQSKAGIANSPTPNGGSLVGSAQSMTADGLRRYLNDGGNLDAALDYVKGLDMQTIGEYVGANILLKDFGAKSINSDPFSSDIISSLGYSIIVSALPDLPAGAMAGNTNDDFRTAIGKAQIESKLGLPAGSLSSFGWDSVLANSGKRLLEQTIGLPSGYLDSHSLADFNKNAAVTGALNYSQRTDTSLNVLDGTVAKLKANDSSAFKLAGVKIIETAFKLSDPQKALLENAVKSSSAPTIDPTTFPSSSTVSAAGIFGIFSSDNGNQNKTIDEFKQLGSTAISQAISKGAPTTTSGLTSAVIDYLINQNKSVSIGDLSKQAGAAQLMNEAGLDGSNPGNFASNSAYMGTVTSLINQTLQLTGINQLQSSDTTSMFSKGDYSALIKIGAAELEKGMGWNVGTGASVMSGQTKLTDATQQSFANSVAQIFGLSAGSFSIQGDASANISYGIIEQALGLPTGSLQGVSTAAQMANNIGLNNFLSIFGVNPTGVSTDAWSDPGITARQSTASNNIGVATSTLQDFLMGKIGLGDVAKQTLNTYSASLTTDKLKTYFNIQDSHQPSDDIYTNILALIKSNGVVTTTVNGKVVTVDRKKDAINGIYSLIGSVIDSSANYNIDGFKTYITSSDPGKAVNILIDQGVSLFTRSIGVSAGDANYLKTVADQLKTYFNGDPAVTLKEQQIATLQGLPSLTSVQQRQLDQLQHDPGVTADQSKANTLISFFAKAAGIPSQYTQDMQTFLKGDFTTGLYEMSFILWTNEVNKYLPADGQLTYPDLKNTILFSDPGIIGTKANQLADKASIPTTDTVSRLSLYDVARKILMDQFSKDAQYKMSDAFLRKADPTVPAGFTKIMMQGTNVEKTQMIEKFAISTLDSQLVNIIPGYKSGMLQTIVDGKGDSQTQTIIQLASSATGLRLGPMSANDTASFVTYLSSSSSKQQNYFTDPKYQTMWHSLDGWLANVTGIGGLPPGVAESIIYAAKNNWDFNASLDDSQGNTVVRSIKDIGEAYLVQKVTNWADKAFGFKPGTTMQFYEAYQAYQAGDDEAVAFHIAIAVGGKDAAKYIQLYQSFQTDPYGTVINYAISSCSACQQLFGQVDKAIKAPPGFTNQLVQGLVIFIFTGNPIGLIQAAMTYFFGVYEIDYLCPTPPADPFSQPSYDSQYDQMSFGYPYTPDKDPLPSGSPSLNAPPIYVTTATGKTKLSPIDAWIYANNIQFSDGNNQDLWMAWARYYTGFLIERTVDYGSEQTQSSKPRQLITYRRANAEYFQGLKDQVAAAFGSIENGNSHVGIGFTQDSTRTTNWVHVGFGGL